MRKKRKNGDGSVSRRKNTGKYTAKITVGFGEKGCAIQKSIGTFRTYEEAADALEDCKKSPAAWNCRDLKLSEIWEIFAEKRLPGMAKSSRSSFAVAYNHCKPLHNQLYLDLVQMRLQDISDEKSGSYSVQTKIRNLFSHLNSLAFELGLDIKKIRPDLLKVSKYEAKIAKKVFTDEEIRRVKKLSERDCGGKIVPAFLYSGLRFTELCELKKSDYNAENQTIKCGIKTKAGRGRTLPLHPFLQDFFAEQAGKSEPYLFGTGGKPPSENALRGVWNGVMNALGLDHTPHECRHTFETRMRLAGADEVILDKIIGHIGRDVYTHFTAEMLHAEIKKLQ